MSCWRLVVRSLLYHWRVNAAIALGVAAATAVLTGALLVGDSVRGSLKRLTLDRLGRIDEALVQNRFFRSQLADELAADLRFRQHYASAAGVILFPHGTVETQAGERPARAAQVLIVGSSDTFWDLGQTEYRPARLPGRDEVILNAALAEELGARVGDDVVLRLPKSNQVPADSLMGRKTERVRSIAGLTVIEIVPAESLGRFRLQASQTTSRNAYAALETLQDALDLDGQINTILVAGASPNAPPNEEAAPELSAALRPGLSDYGFSIQRVRRTFPDPSGDGEAVIYDYFNLTTDRMLFSPAAQEAMYRALADEPFEPVLTYLANSISKADAETDSQGIPYSLVAAIDTVPGLADGNEANRQSPIKMADHEIVLNSWAAADLNAKVGDGITLTYYQPETTHGDLAIGIADFILKAIVPLTEPAKPYRRNRPAEFTERPTPANDPDLTPTVEGVTDQDSINNWEAPFPIDRSLVHGEDDEYWQNHRTTPKAFISLEAGKDLWASRFGALTGVRIPAPAALPVGGEEEREFVQHLEEKLTDQLARDKSALGFQFQPVKRRQLEASKGATPFDVLFLALSFFVIAAALMLVTLLFRLDVERRASEIGTLQAMGFRTSLTMRLLVTEGAILAAIGGWIGVAAGVGYAWLMLAGLRSWWLGAIVTPFLQLYITETSLAIGYASGVIVCTLTIMWSVWRTKRIAVTQLLAGQAGQEPVIARTSGHRQSGATGVSPVLRWFRRQDGGTPQTPGATGVSPVLRWFQRQDSGTPQTPSGGKSTPTPGFRRSLAASAVLLLGAMTLAIAATQLGGEAQAGSFVGAGAAVLLSLLILVRAYFTSGGRFTRQSAQISLGSLAARNAARNPGRSTMTIALMAAASFLVVALSSFRLAPTARGTGGFDLMAESSQPLFADFNTGKGREELLADGADVLQGGSVQAFRVQDGDDASCNNLYQATQPRVLGVTDQFVEYFGREDVQPIAWAASAAAAEPAKSNPWRLLAGAAVDDGDAVPVVLDKNMAMYSLKLYKGIGQEFELTYDDVGTIRFRVVGLLANSILQGNLLIGEADFKKRFPSVSGYRFFLIESPPGKAQAVTETLEERLGDQGFDVVSTDKRLADFFAVQNTYLSTFQSLGALGLLLGTFGMATVQVRNVVERRRELALMRASGFRHRRLAGMVLLENVALLFGGLATGTLAALVAVLPHMVFGGATVPVRDLATLLGVVLAVGTGTSLISVRSTLRAPILAALRSE